METVLETRGLGKRYGKTEALSDVDLDIRAGEVVGFLGRNGAGKTTFTKCVSGQIRPSAGSVSVCGVDAIQDPVRAARHMGLVPDEYEFYPKLTGRDHLDFYGKLYGMPDGRRRKAIDQALAAVGMEAKADIPVRKFSHGMKQRICLAQAVLHGPDFVMLDEPTNGLDPMGIRDLQELIRHFAGQGMAVFLSSHILSDVEKICDRVAIIADGRLRLVDDVAALRRRTAEPHVRVRLARPEPRVTAALEKRAGRVTVDGDWLSFPATEAQVPAYLHGILQMGGQVVEVAPVVRDLESVFMEITGDDAGAPGPGAGASAVHAADHDAHRDGGGRP